MKVNQTTNICPRLKPVQLPLVGKCVSINSATRIFCRKAMMTGISSVRSWVMVICSLIPRAYLNSYFLAKIRTNCEINGVVAAGVSIYSGGSSLALWIQNLVQRTIQSTMRSAGARFLVYIQSQAESLAQQVI